MVDEEIKDVSGGPTGAPVNRDSRREPEVIEGEIAAREAEDSNASPYETAAETRADARPARKSDSARWRSEFCLPARWAGSSFPRSASAPAIRF